MKHKIALLLTLVVLGLTVSANAQNRTIGWKKMIDAARSGEVKIDKEILSRVNEAYSEKSDSADVLPPLAGNLTGTWYCTVPTGPNPEDFFNAYQTFGNDGTFSETSSLLGALPEGPAHGVYERSGRGYLLTFELFLFDQMNGGATVGRARVRNFITMTSGNTFSSDSAVDIIEPDGTVIPNVATGIYTAERVQVRGLYKSCGRSHELRRIP